MKVILIEDVKSLGKKDDVVEVNDGYARNFLLKTKKGIEATTKNLNDLKLKNANEDKIAKEILAEAKELKKEIEAGAIIVSIKTGEGGKAFGSVSSKEVAEETEKQLGLKIDKKKVQLKEPLKTLGAHEVNVKLHPQVSATLKVHVTEEV
ncbi:MAG TPA: 50S ribosomal protein L9 [Candidatus Dorea intestinavium]|nr:50S ribosomal protein L9 [Candidatus Dorea intestinavium]